MPARRENNRRSVGAAFEERAEKLLLESGYIILARNFRTRYGEIDRIVEKDGVVIYVEVKMRRSDAFGDAAAAVDDRKARQLYRIAEQFIQEHPELENADMRFDVVAIDIDSAGRVSVEHMQGVDVEVPED